MRTRPTVLGMRSETGPEVLGAVGEEETNSTGGGRCGWDQQCWGCEVRMRSAVVRMGGEEETSKCGLDQQ